MKIRQIALCLILGNNLFVVSSAFSCHNSKCIVSPYRSGSFAPRRSPNNPKKNVICLFAKETNKKSKIAGPRASSRPPPASRQTQNESSDGDTNPWNVIKGSFYNARDAIENGMKSSSNKQIGAGYQDDENDKNLRARLLIQNDEAELSKSDEKDNNVAGWFFTSSSSEKKKKMEPKKDPTLNPIVTTLSQPSRNSPDTRIPMDDPTDLQEIKQSPIDKILGKRDNVSLLNNNPKKIQDSRGIKQISMDDPPTSEKKLTDQIQEIPQAIQGNIENTRRTAKEIQDKMNTLEESYSDMVHKIKVLMKQEKPKLKPQPPKPKPKLRTSDLAKFSLEAGGGLTLGLFKSIGSSTAWAINKTMEKQKNKENLDSLVDTDWTKNVQKYDTGNKSTEELLAEFDPDLSAEVAEALRLAQEALDAIPQTEEEQTDIAMPEPVVDLSTAEDEIIQKQDLEKVVSEEVKEEEIQLNLPDMISASDTAELEEEIENFLAKENDELNVDQTSKITKPNLKDENTEVIQEVEDALKRARKAAEEAKRDVEELQRMLQSMS